MGVVTADSIPPTPGNLYRYQNEGVAEGAVCTCMKGKEIAKGKKGKAESRMQKGRSQKGQKSSRRTDIGTYGEDTVENSRFILIYF